MNRSARLLFAAGALAALAGFFSTSSSATERFDHQVRNYFFAGFSGNRTALEKGMAITESVIKENPNHAEALVWHGAGLFYQAGQLFMTGKPQEGMPLAQKGVAYMDKAVELEPQNVGVRIPRGAVLASAARQQRNPETAKMFLDRALADYEATYEIQKEYVSKLSEHARGELLIGLADLNARSGKPERAEEFFLRIQKEMPGTRYAESAALWLETKQPLPAQKAGCMGCHVGK